MKKIMLLLLLIVGGCQNEPEQHAEGEFLSSNQGSEIAIANLDEKMWSNEVTIKIPEQFVSVEMVNNLEEYKSHYNIPSGSLQEDKSLELSMTKRQRDQIITAMQDDIVKQLDNLVEDKNLSSIHRVDYNDDFTKLDITIKPKDYANSFDSFQVFNALSNIVILHLYKHNRVNVVLVTYVDVTTGEIIEKETFFEGEN